MASIPNIQALPSVETDLSTQRSEPTSPAHPSTTKPLKSSPNRRSPSPELRTGENRLRPAGDIINRITWDSNFERNDYIIGFVDRFEGQLEVTLDSWKRESTDEEFIPQHRVLYIRHTNGEVVWDRRRRIDKIFNSGNSAFSELAFLQ
ncbi:uncharacterized protein N7469_003134 [Penicillium citrinum]|uniref:MJ1316 RNA cyclic group end recognition domain-containing protein n=2 Tax=Penicillium TaxID=5073 RepID=A0A9W9PDZ4_PENCI|nr:uncharacterized protein N7469_003134 [Penicillium citrinum]KAJ5241543.1 hypothetical protein N7469_003134 [Penicillium citrinum]KAJ5586554.1 hypothetical protein N7450_006341 [Penicillium hetheringtonii]